MLFGRFQNSILDYGIEAKTSLSVTYASPDHQIWAFVQSVVNEV